MRGNQGNEAVVRDIVLFDHNIQVECGKEATGYKLGINVHGFNRDLEIQALNIEDFFDILYCLQKAIESYEFS